MNKDTLFLLNADFFDGEKGPYFCPGCAQMIGLLEIYPKLKERIDIRYADFPRPRPELIDLLGAENQSCPVLILNTPPADPPANLKVQNANGRFFVEGANEIAEYLAHACGTGIPH